MSEPSEPGRPNVVGQAIDRAKRHPIVLVVTTVVAVLVFLGTIGDVAGRLSGAVGGWLNPHEEEYERIARIDLGTTPEYLEARLGPPRRSLDVCREVACPPEAEHQTLTMNVYESEFVVVRAMFADSSLEWYTVTLLSDELQPPMTWLDHDLGDLGTVSYADALAVPDIEPTDVDIFLGPQSSAYVEVVAAGAAADHRGLILASDPIGWSAPFDRGSADGVLPLNEAPFDAAVARRFRSESRPNTFGQFVDDGTVASLIGRDAEFDRVLLHTVTRS